MPCNKLNNTKVTNCSTEKIFTLNLSLRRDHTSKQMHEVYNLNYRSEKANGFPGHDGGNRTERCSAY